MKVRNSRVMHTAQTIEPTTESLQTWLVARLSELHGVDPATIDVRERFGRYGLDSLRASELLAQLGAGLGRVLSPTLVWEHPTIEALARHLSGGPAAAPERARAARGRPGESEPIAVVGMACRFPGAPDLDGFWRVLRDGVDTITEVPAGRWDLGAFYDGDPAAPGKMATRWGGFLDQVDGFDPLFFGISPREAERMDPQQRLMLELSWEALEDAGAAPEGLKGSRTGVFFGAMWDDYARRTAGAPETISAHTATGQDLSIIPARVSYTLGLQGPSLAVSTACSSSLVAVHLACQSLREGESEVALAGGVNLILSPESTVAMSKFGGLSPDGRCFSFDARANGYVRSEGGGVVVLKALSRAIADGDRIYCVLRGSAVNNDGASNGLTAPNPWAQEAVLREAYERAGVDPATVDYVEAHGTGTQLGDPIEARALGAVLGAARAAERPLLVGSAKANVGHLEAAAGVVGLIKVALCLQHGAIPPSLHFQTPNPHIPFSDLHLSVPRARVAWPAGDAPRTAGISSFGFGGTNAHLVVQSAGGPREELLRELTARPAGSDSPPRVVFVFSGQGSQWLGMGRSLLRDEPVFRAALEACERLVRQHLGWSVLAEIMAHEAQSRRDEVDITYPLVVSLEIALAALWRSWGVEPSSVVGHSIGEVAAAHVAGALSLEDAMRVICTQGRLMRRIRGQGVMGLVALSWDEAGEVLRGYEGRLVRAIHTGPAEVVLSGEPAALTEVLQSLESRGVFCRRVNADVAPHSAQLDPLREAMTEALRTIAPRRASIPLFSSVTGGVLDGACLDASHWVRSLADPLQFSRAIEAVAATDSAAFVEIGPHPVVGRAIESILRHAGRSARVVSSLRRDEDERRVLLGSLRALEATGSPVKWDVVAHREPPDDGTVHLLPLSAAGPEALAALATSLSALLGRGEVRLRDLVYTAAVRRSHLPHRLAVVGRTREEMVSGLDAFVRGRGGRDVVHGVSVPGARPKVVFVFSGQGSQWVGMGRSLLAREPVFRAVLEECDRAIQTETGWSVVDELAASEASSRLGRIDVVQPVLFAVQVALSALWRSWGVEPSVVVGHSMGEVAAAHVAGALSLEGAVAVICRRSRLLLGISGQGEMAAVALSLADAEAALVGYEDRLSVAVSNSPRSTVLSGDPAALAEVLSTLEARGVFCRRVKITVASHSLQVDPLQAELVGALAGLAPRVGSVAMHSTVTGEVVTGSELVADYWADNLRQPVRFAQVVEALVKEGHGVFVEMSPHPILVAPIDEQLSVSGRAGVAVGSLQRDEDEHTALLTSLGALFSSGVTVDWKRLYPEGGRCVSLPTYPWQRQRYWLEASRPKGLEAGAALPAAWQAMLEAKDGATFVEHLGLSSALSAEQVSGVSQVLEALRETTQQAGMEAQIREWLYAAVWRSRPLPAVQAVSAAPAAGHWVVLVDEEGVGERLVGALEAVGATCSRRRLGAVAGGWTREALGAWWAERVAERGPVRGVVHLWSLGAPVEGAGGLDMTSGLTPGGGLAAAGALDAALSRGVYTALSLVQAMAGASQEQAPRLWLVTRGAMSVGAADPVVAPEQATLWGLGRVVSLEHPELWGGLIDLPAAPSEAAEQALLAQVLRPDGEDHVALRSSRRYVARLERHRPADKASRPWSTTGTALITGGLGALGLHVARWLARKGVKHLVLTGRRGAESVEAKAAVASLEALGVGVTVAKADVADAAAVAAVLADIEARLPPLTAVFHAAGVAEDGLLMQQDAIRLRGVLAPKVHGAWNLHLQTRHLPLEAFVVFSSVVSVVGAMGQGGYPAGNAAMDALVHHRRAAGLGGHSLNWGLWADGGMASDESMAVLERHGICPMRPQTAIHALSRALEGEAAQVVVADIDWPRFREVYELGGARPLVAEMPRAEVAPAGPAVTRLSSFRTDLQAAPPEKRRPMLSQWVREAVAQTLGFRDPAEVKPTAGFFTMGMSSLTSLELKNRLQAGIEPRLPATLAFDYPNVTSLVEHLESLLFGVRPGAAVIDLQVVSAPLESGNAVHPETEDSSPEAIARRFAEQLGMEWNNDHERHA